MSRFLARVGALAFACVASAGPVWAQANRTFVSGNGSDTNPCSLAQPCRSFAQALSVTNPGGEITVLDPAGYGTVVINKSISIVNDGVGEAGITSSSQADAISINGSTGVVVNLRGLTLVGQGVGSSGISFQTTGTLNIQNCVIRGFTLRGIQFFPTGSSSLNVSDTIVSNNGGQGIWVEPTGNLANTPVTATFERVQSIGNTIGFLVDSSGLTTGSSLSAAATDSLAADNGLQGFTVQTGSGPAPAVFSVVSSRSISNTAGLVEQGANAALVISQVTVLGNTQHGYFINGAGAIKSFGNNYILDGGNSGSLTPISQQ